MVSIESIVRTLAQHPRQLFLIDGLGAALSAFLLLLIQWNFNAWLEMPFYAIGILLKIALVFAAYSLGCALFLRKKHKTFLSIILSANLLYCFLTFVLVVLHFRQLTLLGVSYFIAEILVILGLAFIEIRTLQKLP